MSQAILLGACTVLFIVPLLFVLHPTYLDGVLGRAALLCISFAAAMFLGEATFGHGVRMPPLGVLLVLAFAVFMLWHLARFHCRILKQRLERDRRMAGGLHAR